MDGMRLLQDIGIGVKPADGGDASLPDDVIYGMIVREFKRLRGANEMLSGYHEHLRRQQSLHLGGGRGLYVRAEVSRLDPDLGQRIARAYGR